MEKLTAKVIKEYIVDKNQPVFADDFKAKGRELVERFGVTVPEALDILNNRNILEIVCKYEHSVEERKQGYWLKKHHVSDSSEFTAICCSSCGYKVDFFWNDWQNSKYCPNCGAKMENNGDDDDE